MSHRFLNFFTIVSSLLFLSIIDVGLNFFNLVPPEDPLVFQSRTYIDSFSPFIESADGVVSIKPEWVSSDEAYRVRKGKLAGRFFLHPGFRPTSFQKNKPPITLRIFAFGGSTTFGQFVGAEASFPGILQSELSQFFPNYNIEVINLGCSGLESERVSILVKAATQYQPDLFVVYSGHNEMMRGDLKNLPETYVNNIRKTMLSISSIARWLNYWLVTTRNSHKYEILKEEAAALKAHKILFYNPLTIEKEEMQLPSHDFINNSILTYSKNLKEVILTAKRSDIPILKILPINNIFYPYMGSAHEDTFTQVDDFKEKLDASRDMFQKGQYKKALTYSNKAIELSPQYAYSWYVRGIIHLSLGQTQRALEDLQLAVDLDCRTHRMTSRLQAAMIDMVESFNIPWFDLRPLFHKELKIKTAQELFIDHVHPTKYGHKLIAMELLPTIKNILENRISEN